MIPRCIGLGYYINRLRTDSCSDMKHCGRTDCILLEFAYQLLLCSYLHTEGFQAVAHTTEKQMLVLIQSKTLDLLKTTPDTFVCWKSNFPEALSGLLLDTKSILIFCGNTPDSEAAVEWSDTDTCGQIMGSPGKNMANPCTAFPLKALSRHVSSISVTDITVHHPLHRLSYIFLLFLQRWNPPRPMPFVFLPQNIGQKPRYVRTFNLHSLPH